MATKKAAKPTVATDGREIGERAMATRHRLLDATRSLLAREGLYELKLVDITREIGASPATFYQYFTDIDDALLCLCDAVEDASKNLVGLLEGPWTSVDDFSQAEEFVRAYMKYWDEHRPVLRVRNLKAEEGDKVFRNKRRGTQVPMLKSLSALVKPNIDAGRLPADTDVVATSAAMLAMLDRLTYYSDGLSSRGTGQAELSDTMTRILFHSVTGIAAS